MKKYRYLQELIESWLANCVNENVKTIGVKHLSRNAARPGGESAAFSSASSQSQREGRAEGHAEIIHRGAPHNENECI